MNLTTLIQSVKDSIDLPILLRKILENYDELDYKSFVEFSDVTYKRNIIFSSPQIDILLICWKKGQVSPIHDHPETCCYLKVLEGLLQEDNYINDSNTIIFSSSVILEPGAIGVKCKNRIVHKITPLEDSISLHIYVPGYYKPNTYELKQKFE